MDDWQLSRPTNIIIFVIIVLILVAIIILLVVAFGSWSNNNSDTDDDSDEEDDDDIFDEGTTRLKSGTKSTDSNNARGQKSGQQLAPSNQSTTNRNSVNSNHKNNMQQEDIVPYNELDNRTFDENPNNCTERKSKSSSRNKSERSPGNNPEHSSGNNPERSPGNNPDSSSGHKSESSSRKKSDSSSGHKSESSSGHKSESSSRKKSNSSSGHKSESSSRKKSNSSNEHKSGNSSERKCASSPRNYSTTNSDSVNAVRVVESATDDFDMSDDTLNFTSDEWSVRRLETVEFVSSGDYDEPSDKQTNSSGAPSSSNKSKFSNINGELSSNVDLVLESDILTEKTPSELSTSGSSASQYILGSNSGGGYNDDSISGESFSDSSPRYEPKHKVVRNESYTVKPTQKLRTSNKKQVYGVEHLSLPNVLAAKSNKFRATPLSSANEINEINEIYTAVSPDSIMVQDTSGDSVNNSVIDHISLSSDFSSQTEKSQMSNKKK